MLLPMDAQDGTGTGQSGRRASVRHPRLAAWAPWMIAALCIGLVAVGVAWAREPLARREILFETPVRIAPGVSVTGAFTPEADVPCAIELRFREVWPEPMSERPRGGRVAVEALGKDVGGGWLGLPSPPGLTARYSVSSGGVRVAAGVTGDRLGGHVGSAAVLLAQIGRARAVPHEFTVHIERAVDGLRRWDARLVVVATGDWISYASLEAGLRITIVVLALPVLVGLGGLAWALKRWASRRTDGARGQESG